MPKDTKIILAAGLIIAVAIVGLVMFAAKNRGGSPELDAFASCLKDSGVEFYGAFWCPHCQDQKRLFGRSAKFLPYIECSTPDGKGQTAACTEKNIQSYPTWMFPDGTREPGEMSLDELSARSGCMIGDAVATSTPTGTTTTSTGSSSPAL